MPEDDSQQFKNILPGTILNGYKIEREIGRGAMAVVYLAIQLDLERPVALKVLSAELAEDKEYVSRFFNEARAAAALSHPNIIQAYDAGAAEGGIYYFCMEYVDGETMLDMIDEQGQVPIEQALKLAHEVAEALDYGWQRHKFTHGDIKPENIMVNADGQAKLADFGLAKIEGHDYDGTDIMLTPLYAAPELIRGEKNKGDCRADIYAFGATLYHAIAGSPPFPGNIAQEVLDKHLHENPEPLRLRYPKTPVSLSDFVGKMLQKDPAMRPQSWVEVIAGLNALARTPASAKKQLVLKATPPHAQEARRKQANPHAKPKAPPSRLWLWYTLATIGLALIIIIAFVLMKKNNANTHPETPDVTQTTTTTRPQHHATTRPKPPKTSNPQTTTPQQPENEATTQSPRKEPNEPAEAAKPTKPADPAEAAEPKQTKPKQPEQTGPKLTEQTKPEPPKQEQPQPAVRSREPLIELARSLEIPFTPSEEFRQQCNWYNAAECLFKLRYDLTLQTPVEPMMKLLETWLKGKDTSQDHVKFIAFVHSTVLPALEQARADIVRDKAKVIGSTVLDRNRAKNIIRDVAFDSVKMDLLLANGKVSRTASWDAINKDGILEGICKIMLAKSDNNLNAVAPYAAMLMFIGRGRQTVQLLSTFPQDQNARFWLILAQIGDYVSPALRNAVKAMRQLEEACADANEARATEICASILSAQIIALPDKDKATAREILERTNHTIPSHQAGLLLRNAAKLSDRQKFSKAMSTALLVKARYGDAKFPEKSKLNSLITDNLSMLPPTLDEAPGGDIMSALFITPRPPTTTAVIIRDFLESQHNDAIKKVYENFKPIAAFNYGDWSVFRDIQDIKIDESNSLRNINIMLSFEKAFALSLLEDRLTDRQPSVEWTADARQFSNTARRKASVLVLIAQTALLTHHSGNNYALQNLTWPVNTNFNDPFIERRLLFYLAFTLFNEDTDSEDALDNFKEFLAKRSPSNLGFVNEPDTKNMRSLTDNPSSITSLPLDSNSSLTAASIRAWLALADPQKGLPPSMDEEFAEAVANYAADWGPLGGDAIYSFLLLRCAFSLRNNEPATALKLTDMALNIHEPCMFPYYPELLALRAGICALTGKHGAIYTAALNIIASSVASDTEKKLAKTLAELKPLETIKKTDAIIKKLPDAKPALFWTRWTANCLAIGTGTQPAPFEPVFKRFKPSPAELALASALNSLHEKIQK